MIRQSKGGNTVKLKGELLLREVAGEIIAVPVGRTALNFNGMICLNDVSAQILNGLQQGKTKDALLHDILEAYEVSQEEASADLEAFLLQLRENDLLEY
jgi:hypothetical protein